MKKLNLNININSLDEFYRECDNIEGGNPAEINNIERNDDPSFRGLSTAEIYDSEGGSPLGMRLKVGTATVVSVEGAYFFNAF